MRSVVEQQVHRVGITKKQNHVNTSQHSEGNNVPMITLFGARSIQEGRIL